MALFHLWAAWDIVPTTTLRFVHVGFALALGFLLFPAARRFRHRLMPWDWLLIAAALVRHLVPDLRRRPDRLSR